VLSPPLQWSHAAGIAVDIAPPRAELRQSKAEAAPTVVAYSPTSHVQRAPRTPDTPVAVANPLVRAAQVVHPPLDQGSLQLQRLYSFLSTYLTFAVDVYPRRPARGRPRPRRCRPLSQPTLAKACGTASPTTASGNETGPAPTPSPLTK
jgi:hypothetical protein